MLQQQEEILPFQLPSGKSRPDNWVRTIRRHQGPKGQNVPGTSVYCGPKFATVITLDDYIAILLQIHLTFGEVTVLNQNGLPGIVTLSFIN